MRLALPDKRNALSRMKDFTPLSPDGLRPVATHSWLLKGIRGKSMAVGAKDFGAEAASTARRSCFQGWNRPAHTSPTKTAHFQFYEARFADWLSEWANAFILEAMGQRAAP
jgi:hypothetical protein